MDEELRGIDWIYGLKQSKEIWLAGGRGYWSLGDLTKVTGLSEDEKHNFLTKKENLTAFQDTPTEGSGIT